MKMRGIVIDQSRKRIRFEDAVQYADTDKGLVVDVGKKSVLLGGETYGRDPPFPWLIVASIPFLITAIAFGVLATLYVGPIYGLAFGLPIGAVGGVCIAFGIKRWRPVTYFLMLESSASPLQLWRTVDYMANGGGDAEGVGPPGPPGTRDAPKKALPVIMVAPVPYSADEFHAAIHSDIATKFMRRDKFDVRTAVILVLVITVAALAFATLR